MQQWAVGSVSEQVQLLSPPLLAAHCLRAAPWRMKLGEFKFGLNDSRVQSDHAKPGDQAKAALAAAPRGGRHTSPASVYAAGADGGGSAAHTHTHTRSQEQMVLQYRAAEHGTGYSLFTHLVPKVLETPALPCPRKGANTRHRPGSLRCADTRWLLAGPG